MTYFQTSTTNPAAINEPPSAKRHVSGSKPVQGVRLETLHPRTIPSLHHHPLRTHTIRISDLYQINSLTETY